MAVRVALIARGIAGERLLARGYGVTKPLCPDRTPACLARSRRIDFLIIRRTEEARKASEPRLFGCWTVTAPAPAKSFKVGEQLCLTETALVVRDPRGAIIDGWLVAWKPTPARWRADVQGRDGTALPGMV